MDKYLTAKEAADLLNISLPTLYAYVSRNLIRSEEADAKRRTRKYLREDVETLLNRKELRKNPSKATENALDWGQPILESAITKIENGRFYYRGHDACQLAQTSSFEAVCELLWQGKLSDSPLFFEGNINHEWLSWLDSQPHLRQIDQFQILLPLASAHNVSGYDLSKTAVSKTGRQIIAQFLALASNQAELPPNTPAKTLLQQAWSPALPAVQPLINMALVLCADHELNVSAFTARAVASARSTPYTAVNAGLSALTGVLHGGVTERVQALMREAQQMGSARQAIGSRLRRGENVSGFHHKLYPDGDPRATLLLAEIRRAFPKSEIMQMVDELITAVYEAINVHPNIDLALVALALVAQFPPDSPLTLFAIGRTAGWLGHIIEQYQTQQLIRPRAKYIGQ